MKLPESNSERFNNWFMKTSIYRQMYGGVINEQDTAVTPRKKALLDHAEILADKVTVWHIYEVYGEKRYYRGPIKELEHCYLGTGEHPVELYGIQHTKVKRKAIKVVKGDVINAPPRSSIKENQFQCCYCEDWLTQENYSRDHVIALGIGGLNTQSNLRPCCNECNQQKSNMPLSTYIQYLNYLMKDIRYGTTEYNRLQTKIKNVNMIAKQFSTPSPQPHQPNL